MHNVRPNRAGQPDRMAGVAAGPGWGPSDLFATHPARPESVTRVVVVRRGLIGKLSIRRICRSFSIQSRATVKVQVDANGAHFVRLECIHQSFLVWPARIIIFVLSLLA